MVGEQFKILAHWIAQGNANLNLRLRGDVAPCRCFPKPHQSVSCKKSHSLPVCTACHCLPLGLLRAAKYAIKADCILPWISTSFYPLHQCSCISTWLVSLIRSRWKEMNSGNFNPHPSLKTIPPFTFPHNFQMFVNAWGIVQVPLSKRFWKLVLLICS